MRRAILFVFSTFMLSPPASAQLAPGISAGVNVNTPAVDAARLKDLRCRLKIGNPRACVQQPTPSQQPSASNGRGNTVAGAPKPDGKRG